MAESTLLLTRPQAQSLGFAETCRAAGWTGPIVTSPILEIVPRPMPNRPAPGTTLIFTSVNGVEQATAQHDLAGFHAFAVGDTTAKAAQEAGMTCVSANGDFRDLLALLARHDTGPLLHLRGTHSAGDLTSALAEMGREAVEWVVYDQVAQPLNGAARRLLAAPGPVVLPLFSPRSARLLSAAVGETAAPLSLIAISQAAADAWRGNGTMCVVADPTGKAMLAAIVAQFDQGAHGSGLVDGEPKS
ncbi:uroporphyrinogen-III synthase [Oceaniglobus ichthyenteri]|uniref:uroporphyrinogen-III synthase n=1 Tax=Oceaniglobus ichthyenteri TaxID=2136177 RepID=UPI000D34439D|nr:uroporphyrinogen-III synthase [Oceaniglobus ichthyenteri]